MKYWTIEDRRKFVELYDSGMKIVDIAAELGFGVTSTYAELNRGKIRRVSPSGRIAYSPETAQRNYEAALLGNKHKGRKSNEKSS